MACFPQAPATQSSSQPIWTRSSRSTRTCLPGGRPGSWWDRGSGTTRSAMPPLPSWPSICARPLSQRRSGTSPPSSRRPLATCAACTRSSIGSATGWQPIWSRRGWLWAASTAAPCPACATGSLPEPGVDTPGSAPAVLPQLPCSVWCPWLSGLDGPARGQAPSRPSCIGAAGEPLAGGGACGRHAGVERSPERRSRAFQLHPQQGRIASG